MIKKPDNHQARQSLDAFIEKIMQLNPKKVDLSLTRIKQLLELFDNPQNKISNVIHIAGTNGKGSVSAYMQSILKAGGYRVNAFVSPHLRRINERIILNSKEISDQYLFTLIERIEKVRGDIPITFFEFMTASAFLAFFENEADFNIIETGLGGRLDATNVVEKPCMSLITSIGIDHQDFLGNSVEEIAKEKAGIMKKGVITVSSQQSKEVTKTLKKEAEKISCDLYIPPEDWSYYERIKPLTMENTDSYSSITIKSSKRMYVKIGHNTFDYPKGSLEIDSANDNACLAVAASHLLNFVETLQLNLTERSHPIDARMINLGLKFASNPGRMEKINVRGLSNNCEFYIDGAHNTPAAKRLRRWLDERENPTFLLLGMSHTKDHESFIKNIAEFIKKIYIMPISTEEKYTKKANDIYHYCLSNNIDCDLSDNCKESIAKIIKETDSLAKSTVLACGSLYLYSQVKDEGALSSSFYGV